MMFRGFSSFKLLCSEREIEMSTSQVKYTCVRSRLAPIVGTRQYTLIKKQGFYYRKKAFF